MCIRDRIEVLSTSGDNHLGGDDFNDCIAKYIVDEFKSCLLYTSTYIRKNMYKGDE